MVRTRSGNGSANGTTGQGRHLNGNGLTSMTDPPTVKIPQAGFIQTTLLSALLMLIMPNFIMWIWYTVLYHNGSYVDFIAAASSSPQPLLYLAHIWYRVSVGTPFCLLVIFGYMAFQLFLMVVVPGERAEGPITINGNVPIYKDNGFRIFLITMACFAALTFYLKNYTSLSPSLVYDHYGDLLATMNAFALLFCVLLYLKGRFAPSTTDSGLSGNPIFDYYWGTELYPRIFGIDIKVFTNCRFGCTVWAVAPCCFAIKAYELHGFEGSINSFVSVAILLVYLTKFFWWEAGYMCTIDIILDRAGYYICWGCMCVIPGLYCSFSFYLVSHPIPLGYPLAAAILAAGLSCVAINYTADWQRLVVRASNGKTTLWGKKAEVIRAKYITSQGEEKSSLLLVSGFWGLARHFHYLPELGLAFFWTVPCGFDHFLPYSYVTFLLVLLVHRTYRDDLKCTQKYGKYWAMYKEKVPYRIIPYVF